MSSDDERRYEALLRRHIEHTIDGPDGLSAMADHGDFDVELIGVNESRVDATVRASGREWRVVFGTADGESVEWFSVFERPQPFHGCPGGRIVVVNGASGSGKSAAIAALAQLDARPWIVFDEPHLGQLSQPFLIWRETAPTVHRGFLDGIAAVARAANLVAVAAGGHPMSEFEQSCAGTPTLYVGLHCDIDTLIERERGRDGRWGGLAARSMSAHVGWTYDIELDSSQLTPDEIARAILDVLDDQPTPT